MTAYLDPAERRDTILINGICGQELAAAIEAEVRKQAEPIIKAAAAELAERLSRRIESVRDCGMSFGDVRVLVSLNGERVADSRART